MSDDVVAGKYRLSQLLGRGGMGAVYAAVNLDTEREVALKVLHAEFASRPDVYERFRLEARAAARIKHPGVVEVLDFGSTPEGVGYLVMERISGLPLDVVLRARRRLSLPEALPVFIDILSTLRAAHASGIVHRDLKPGNIFLARGTPARTKLLDFGISKFQNELHSITQTGVMLGTVSYMAPEQLMDSKTVTGAADLWAVGAMMFRALTGRAPFSGETDSVYISQVLTGEALRIRQVEPGLPVETSALVDPLLRRDPAERPTLDALVGELERLSSRLQTRPVGAVIDSLLYGVDGHPRAALPEPTTTPSSRPNQPPAAMVTTHVPPPRPRGRARAFAVGAALLVGLGGVSAWQFWSKPQTAPPPERPPLRENLKPVETPLAPAPPLATSTLDVATRPAHARVEVEGALCASPCRLEGVLGERRRLVATAAGYRSRTLEVRLGDVESLTIELERTTPAKVTPPRAGGPGALEVDPNNPYR
jgi:eukaryotic-like serine/threonine-protein kinase